MLEDETGQSQYQGHMEGAQSATYYLLMMQAKEFVAIPAGSWYVQRKFISFIFSVTSSFCLGLSFRRSKHLIIKVTVYILSINDAV